MAGSLFGGDRMNQNNNQSLDSMLEKASQKLGTDSEKLKSAASTGKISDLLKNLGTKEAQKVTNILSDKEAASKLLSTPKAKQLLKKLLGDK